MKLLQLTNSFSNKKELFEPIKPPTIKMYVCGITPYDYAHIGHGRCYVTFDVLVRLLTISGYDVTYCRNFTDIDDKLMARAQRELGSEYKFKEIADKFIEAYHQDMADLNCKSPNYEPRVTDLIDSIISFIEELISAGKAYVVDGDVYYSIESFSDYGKLSKRDLNDLIAGSRVSLNDKKRAPLDFALWKGEEEGTFWKSPWGWGRPGWHIECSAMARLYLGDTIDIHGGGMDLIFPHHENEVAQSEGLTGLTFAKYWIHNAFVRIDQEKMSKSLGNFITLRDLFHSHNPMVVRYYFLQHHYRNPLDFSFDELDIVQKNYQRLAKLLDGVEPMIESSINDLADDSIAQRMLAFLRDDLNTSGMFGIVFENSKQIQENDALKAQVKGVLSNVLGLKLQLLAEEKIVITPQMSDLINQREEARKNKNWSRADELRDELRTLGYDVQDKKL